MADQLISIFLEVHVPLGPHGFVTVMLWLGVGPGVGAGVAVKFTVALSLDEYSTLSSTVAVSVPDPELLGVQPQVALLGEALTLTVQRVEPLRLNVTVPPKPPPESGCVPAVATARNVQLPVVQSVAVMLTDGRVSLQLWTSSVALMFVFLEPPFTNMSIEKALTFAPPTVSLAAAGVQLVANLPETLSIVWALPAPLFGLYQEGNTSVLGLGSTDPRPTWLRMT